MRSTLRAPSASAMVVAGAGHLEIVDTLAVVVPISTVDRGWPNHVEVIGAELGRRSWAMSEQIRTISRERLVGHAGRADQATLAAVRSWIADFLDLQDGAAMQDRLGRR